MQTCYIKILVFKNELNDFKNFQKKKKSKP